MPETATPDVPVASSPTPETAPVESPSLELLTRAERQEWRKTGEIPTPKPEGSAPSTESSETPKSEPAPASQPDVTRSKPKNADTRKAELQREIQDLLKQRDTLKREVQPGAAPAVPPPASAPAKPEAAKDDPEPTDRLNPATGKPWKDWNEFDQAKRAWDRREAVRTIERSLAAKDQERQTREQAVKLAEGWNQRVQAAVKDLGVKQEDYDTQVNEKLGPHMTPVVAQFILESPHGPKVAWYLAENPSIAQQMKTLPPWQAARALFRIEQSVSADPSTPTPAPKTTRTSKPAPDLGARNAAPADEEEAAVAQGDFRRFKSVANSRSLRK